MAWLKLIWNMAIGFVIANAATGLVVGLAHWPLAGWLTGVMTTGAGLLGAGIAFQRWSASQQFVRSDVHGSAQFGSLAQAKRTLGGGEGLIVGRTGGGWLLRYDGPAHLLTIAPTRSGKGVGAIIPNLLTADRSILCVDPKGENTRVAARSRGELGPVYVLDPFEVSGETSAAFNPLAGLDADSVDLSEDTALIAEALVYDPPYQVGEAHWNEEAKALIAGLILHVVTSTVPAHRNLGTLRELLTTTPERFKARLSAMQTSRAAHGLVARAANRHLSKADREAAGVLSAAQRHTHFLDSPRMARVLSRSDFAFADLKTEVATVFLVLPPDRLATHARWLRLMVVQALSALARSSVQPAKPVLLLLDEFAALGRLEPVERAFGLMAGYGVQLWAILQDLHQLKAAYGDAAGTFLSNAGLIQVFNIADIDTATWVSRMLGVGTEAYQTTGATTTHSPGQWSAAHGSSTAVHFTQRPLMTPDEVMRMDGEQLLLLRPGQAPIVASKVRYYDESEFAGLFDAQT